MRLGLPYCWSLRRRLALPFACAPRCCVQLCCQCASSYHRRLLHCTCTAAKMSHDLGVQAQALTPYLQGASWLQQGLVTQSLWRATAWHPRHGIASACANCFAHHRAGCTHRSNRRGTGGGACVLACHVMAVHVSWTVGGGAEPDNCTPPLQESTWGCSDRGLIHGCSCYNRGFSTSSGFATAWVRWRCCGSRSCTLL